MMKRKLVWTAVLAAMVAAGTTGVYAAPTLEDHETRIVDLENLTDKIDDRSETDHLAIKGLKQNKADKAETEAAIKENKDMITQELKDRKSADRILNKAIADEASAREEADKRLQANIDTEATSREEADKRLQTNIDTEASARKAGDTFLQGQIDSLHTETNKGLAKVTALTGLHPLDFDPANKWNVAVATGTYKSETSVALGAFYRPNRDVMFSFGSSISNGDNAYTFGASVKLGRGSSMKGTASVSELYDMIGRMQEQLALQQKKIEELEAKK